MKKFLQVTAIGLSLFALVACGQQTTNNTANVETNNAATESVAEKGAYTVTDIQGREVSFEKVPEKVVAINPSNTEMLDAIGAADKIVARGSYVMYPESVATLPEVESGSKLNVEQIIALEPDVVFMSVMDQSVEQIEALEKAGVPVVMTDHKNTLEEVYQGIQLVGQVMDKEDEANQVVENMKTSFEELAKNKEANEGKTVYFEVSPLEYGLWTSGKGTFMQEVADIIGMKNIFDDVEGWAEVSEEQVLERNPDYIVTITMYYGEGPSPEEEIPSRPGWENVTAVKENHILHIKDDLLSKSSPRLVEGAKAFSDFVNEK
ncbi:ABC transporter substrate-binding protein [Peptoniphilus sp. KCTC 25270]|uniref:ABC transporter substrate-binding protein n=1 Tax=Peptoniphilus sp. KCTC 25270 TaxID=2897414 RepID=UPI001E56BBA7|nr:ABC transporter substrate-binding protein [Peptoniphilus sp. KCTC 25270]MCD1146597.1 ABC transporter substrate-binding protein [Peptoniphilus sp. KCTC 25270]